MTVELIKTERRGGDEAGPQIFRHYRWGDVTIIHRSHGYGGDFKISGKPGRLEIHQDGTVRRTVYADYPDCSVLEQEIVSIPVAVLDEICGRSPRRTSHERHEPIDRTPYHKGDDLLI